MTTSRKHLIAALALALPAAALLVSPASAASTVHPKKHHVTRVHHVVHPHHKASVHKASAHHRAVHSATKPQS